jgi:purine-binding chemotaxis protein CheW
MNDRHTAATADPAQVLKARARALARPILDDAQQTLLELLEFRLGKELYAVETRYVSEVYPLKNLTPLPSTPRFVLGIVNVRGRIVPVFDLRAMFDLPEQGLTDLHKMIIVAGRGLELGLLTDAAMAVRLLPQDSLQASLPTLTGIHAEYLKGITAGGLVVLDVERILGDPKIVVHEEVES